MTSNQTQLVIDKAMESKYEVINQLQGLDADKRRFADLCERKDDEIQDLKTEIRNQEDFKYQREEAYEFTMIMLIVSWLITAAAIGYSVWL